ncbi:N-acetyl-beta-glucosaminyl-glycoprotein 4-beta-N-acetylgalactosaminyltransferase 1 [Thalassophryne amazonica]|uniref:N-acetyl-beta-glucosaminyl-glycoprotein 4-beta-N-acetylgalactosaminyltransferase 1 n=1 Tax=Thalassophryne amazonica TaxID=390379 RepID=UPI0014718F6A|nr:N-acetyl-beta-glucosaminyl-glycoprotein 4-beta-N-acetylgalactosaminyltransferase 1 [Thalassophryne amazonica]XP_034032471.1 N-acetyl-beta-glucosaminyl-glycoprotein 4-beta-N-acetylgalactosaminyltransferase 1 [Thalassophryne amazonica]
MIATFFPFKKLRRKSKCVLFGMVLLVGAVALLYEMYVADTWSYESRMNPTFENSYKRVLFAERVRRDHQPHLTPTTWKSSYALQRWSPAFIGRVNLHVFEDWCGGSVATLRNNLHYPLYPHSRTTVKKLAVSPKWTNYGLRIFGYLHPYTNGEFVFALSSDDNSEFWLSKDESPLNMTLLAWVGPTGTEWAAPGEYEKYASQISQPVRLSAGRRYFFEVIHKQNDKGTDHVEVAWRLLGKELMFTVIESEYISLYADESAMLMSDIGHIPQTAASHKRAPTKRLDATADMLREDPRDTFYHVPLINTKFLEGVLPDCSYNPSYTIKDFPLVRYQGLQFIHLSYVYPKDYTRLTHMETETSCFYPESSYYLKRFGFSRYMRLDHSEVQQDVKFGRDNQDNFNNKTYHSAGDSWGQLKDNFNQNYGDDNNHDTKKDMRKLFTLDMQEVVDMLKNSPTTTLPENMLRKRQGSVDSSKRYPRLMRSQADLKVNQQDQEVEQIRPQAILKSMQNSVRAGQTNTVKPMEAKESLIIWRNQQYSKQHYVQKSQRKNSNVMLRTPERNASMPLKPIAATQQTHVNRRNQFQAAATKRLRTSEPDQEGTFVQLNQGDTYVRKSFREDELKVKKPLLQDNKNVNITTKDKVAQRWPEKYVKKDTVYNSRNQRRDFNQQREWGKEKQYAADSDDEEEFSESLFDTAVNWRQTFQVNHIDFQIYRSDWIDQQCNISGNLLLQTNDVETVVQGFMDRLELNYPKQFTLVRVINVVKRVDGIQGSRYLIELELKNSTGQLLRFAQYIYTLVRYSKKRVVSLGLRHPISQMVLCNPVGFQWNPVAMVHFIVPVKNQARWVQQLISDMEELYRVTGDTNFNLIIVDYSSTDMDVHMALQMSSLERYKYVKLSGNFERSAGLQAGADLVTDKHSILFLCDLHIHFPSSIIDTIRKHCVEGYMVFAPIVMRLDCGATPSDARGYWEVNGFGLLGIYKTDLIKIGGMNTKEFTNRWGGEDWELLDRILQGGLEVERIYLRNFFHYYHSKRGMWNRRMSSNSR